MEIKSYDFVNYGIYLTEEEKKSLKIVAELFDNICNEVCDIDETSICFDDNGCFSMDDIYGLSNFFDCIVMEEEDG